MLELNRVYCGDCLELMREIPDGSVDMIWTDPPYNVGKDYGEYKDNLSDEAYLQWCSNWICEAKRISGNRMAIYIPMKYKFDFWNILGKDYREIQLTWGPEGAIRFGFINQFCTLLVNVSPIIRTHNVWYNCQMPGLGWFFRENNFTHPCYTSEDITKRILCAFTNPGDIVCDPFSGTGTTAACCIKLERNYIAIEQEIKWVHVSQKRIDAELSQTKMEF